MTNACLQYPFLSEYILSEPSPTFATCTQPNRQQEGQLPLNPRSRRCKTKKSIKKVAAKQFEPASPGAWRFDARHSWLLVGCLPNWRQRRGGGGEEAGPPTQAHVGLHRQEVDDHVAIRLPGRALNHPVGVLRGPATADSASVREGKTIFLFPAKLHEFSSEEWL